MQCKCGGTLVDRQVEKNKTLAITFLECVGNRCKRVGNIEYHNGFTRADFEKVDDVEPPPTQPVNSNVFTLPAGKPK
jgi:hypothetical protein